VRVQRITVTINEDRFQGISPILLGHVLQAYFGLHSSVNVFTQLALVSRQRDGIWKLWPPMIPSSSDG
jgi:type VI secretion system protein ImpG